MSENKQRSKNTPEEAALVTKAWAEGKKLQHFYLGEWKDRIEQDEPLSLATNLYRVKTEPRTFELWLDTSLDATNPRVYHAPPGTDMSRYEIAGWTKINAKEIV